MTIQDFRIIDAMSQYGGSFAKAIANAAKVADSDNYNKLKQAFPELWEKYESFVFINKDN
jgi:plasmid replication initiation protein